MFKRLLLNTDVVDMITTISKCGENFVFYGADAPLCQINVVNHKHVNYVLIEFKCGNTPIQFKCCVHIAIALVYISRCICIIFVTRNYICRANSRALISIDLRSASILKILKITSMQHCKA